MFTAIFGLFGILSFISPLFVIGAGVLIVGALAIFFGLLVLPDDYKKIAIKGGLLAGAGFLIWQAAYAWGVYAIQQKVAEEIAQVAAKQQEYAERINKEQAELRRKADLSIRQANDKLKEIQNAAKVGPNNACVDRGLAKRLRSL